MAFAATPDVDAGAPEHHLNAIELLAEAMYTAEAVICYGVDEMPEDAWQLLDEPFRQEFRDRADRWVDARTDEIVEQAVATTTVRNNR